MSDDIALTKLALETRIKTHMAWEEANQPYPESADEVPISAEYFTRAWLNDALCAKVPGAEVEAFRFIGDANIGTTARRYTEIMYNAAGEAAGLPKRLFAKATPEFVSRYVCGISGAIASEVNFYNVIAPMLPNVEVPVCYHAAYEPDSFRSIFLFEDASITKGARFLDGTYRLSRTEAESMIRTTAALHSRFWGDPILDTQFTWLKNPYAYQLHINDMIGFTEYGSTGLGVAIVTGMLPEALARRADMLWPAMIEACRIRAEAPRLLVHADIHLGNWYLTENGVMGLCDWQCTVNGGWASDLAYAISSSLDVAERRGWEKELVQLYLDALDLPAGQVKPSFDAAWLAYRQQMLHGFYNWMFVVAIAAGQKMLHSNAITLANVNRMATAIDDHDTLGALGF